MSKTEELALKLGQTKETMEERQTTILRESKLTNRRKIANVTICTLIAVTLFLSEKLNPNSGANLLRYLEDSSVDASVMGTNGQPTLVEFGAPWCQTCQDMAKHVFALRNEFDNRVNFVIVDGDDAKYADLLDQFEVDGLPQFSFVDGNGKDVGDFIGFVPEYVLRENIEALLQGKSSLPHQGISIKLLEQELASKMTKE